MKRGLLGLSLLVLLTRVISAQFYSGYGSFSLTNFFDRIDPQTMILLLLFLIFFVLIFYPLSRFFKGPYGQPNKVIPAIIAFSISAIIIYGLYRTGFDLGSVFYDWGFSVGSLYPILAVVFLIVAFLLIWSLGRTKKDEFGRRTFSLKRGLGGFFMLFGLFLILLTIFTEIFYEKLTTLIIGIVLLVVGLLLWRKRKRKLTGYYDDYGPSPRRRGMFGRMRERRGELRDVKHQQKLDYKRQQTEQKYGRKLHDIEVRHRAKKIVKIRGRREKIEERKGEPERRRQKELQRAQKAAYKEDAKRQKAEQAQGQIQQINNEVARLEQMIPNASVIERGKIEDQIRALLKRAKKLR